MFSSMLDHKDLIFTDSTVRLVHVPYSKQNYKDYLETDFLRAMERMEDIDCITDGAQCVTASLSSTMLLMLTLATCLQHLLRLV